MLHVVRADSLDQRSVALDPLFERHVRRSLYCVGDIVNIIKESG